MDMLKNIHGALLIRFIITYRSANEYISFSAARWMTSVMLTLLLPIIIPIYIIKRTARFITNKDKNEAVEKGSRVIRAYQETSEYEYRSATDVFARIVKNCITKIINGIEFHDDDIVPISSILMDFFAFQGRLYQIRLETKEEFVARRIEEEIGQYSEANKPELEKLFQAQYDIIIEKSAGDILKAFYLGLDVLAKKLPIGNKKKPTPPQSVQEVPQPN